MFSGLISKFPDKYTPSSQQHNLIKNIEKAFDDGYKFVVCSAPTGSGKSFISKTLGNASNEPSEAFTDLVTSYQIYKRTHTGGYAHANDIEDEKPYGTVALTITKALQDQYKELFDDVSVLKGKSNYKCSYDENFTVEYAPCMYLKKLRDDCWSKDSCPYYKARNTAIVSKFATYNYNMFFSLPDEFKRRQVMVCDEASELEDQLVKEYTCTVNFSFLKKLELPIFAFPNSDYGKAGKWVHTLYSNVVDKVDEYTELIRAKEGKTIDKTLNARKDDLIMLNGLRSKLKTLIETWNQSEYLFERDAKAITFIPLKVDKLAANLFDHADKVILMSATIIDPQNFCKGLGITKFKYIEAESTFDASKAPIYANTKVKLNYANLQSNLPKIVDQIKAICQAHKDEKGIIHTQTNTITKYVQDNIPHDTRFLFREPGVKNEDLLDTHYNTSDPTVLVSPSMSHGVDLKGDLARFQIIIKAPYLPTKDIRVERMMKLDQSWYMNKMLSSLIQSCGRGIRSQKDHCVTYILDGSIIEQIIRNKAKIPKYFIDRFM
jgi:Rad3-related DNA helicase